jgi:hypothetical protein
MPPWTITSGHLARAARAILLAGLLAGLAQSGAACGAAFDGTTYRANGIAFQVPPPPESWQQIDVSHAALAFRDVESDATIAVNGRCGRDSPDVPLASLTQHLFIQFTEREVLAQEVVPFDAREAMHSTVLAKLDGVPKKFDVWVLKKDGCVYDLLFIASPSRFGAGIEQFQRFARGFRALPSDAS